MKTLLLLLALPFAADCEQLGSSRWAERHAATQRLAAAGFAAAPALLLATEDAQLERATRATDLLDRLSLSQRLAAALTAADADTLADEKLLPLKAALCREFGRFESLSVQRPDGGFGASLSGPVAIYDWSKKAPHYGGSEAAELRLLLESAWSQRRLAAAALLGGAAATAK